MGLVIPCLNARCLAAQQQILFGNDNKRSKGNGKGVSRKVRNGSAKVAKERQESIPEGDGRRFGLVAAEVAGQFGEGQEEGEDAGGEASHGDHEGQPAAVGVGSLLADAAEGEVHEQGRDDAREEDDGAGGEELAGVWLHKG